MNKRVLFLLVAILLASLLITECAPEPKPTPTLARTPMLATATRLPPTATPLPPTATPLPPTATPLPPTATPQPKRVLRIGREDIAKNKDPHNIGTSRDLDMYLAVYDPLLWTEFLPGGGNRLAPMLATSWRVLDDHVTWEFKLREGVKFHDGSSFDAEDVKASFERFVDPENKFPYAGRLKSFDHAEVIDAHTVHLVTKAPDPIFPRKAMQVFIVPSEYQNLVGDEYPENPAGTGPFAYQDFVLEDHITVAAAEGSWRGEAASDEVTWFKLGEEGVRVAALAAGDVDMIRVTGEIDPALQLQEEGFVLESVANGAGNTFDFDYMQDGEGYDPLHDKRVRLALNYAVDKQAIVDELLGGIGQVPNCQMVAPSGFGYDPDIPTIPYDPEKAKELLAEAGYPDGFKTGLMYGTPNHPRVVAEAVAGYLADVGVQADVIPVETAVLLDLFFGRREGETRAPLFFANWQFVPAMDADQMMVWFQHPDPKIRRANVPAFDELYKMSTTEFDVDKRRELLQQAGRVLCDEVVSLWLFYPAHVYAHHPAVKGFEIRPDSVTFVDKIYVER